MSASVPSGHGRAVDQGPLLGVEQTSQLKGATSANDPKQTYLRIGFSMTDGLPKRCWNAPAQLHGAPN
jgi:hypothetical protein